MFCALNGATATPRRRSHAHSAVAIQLLPAFDDVPPTKIGLARISGKWQTAGRCPRARESEASRRVVSCEREGSRRLWAPEAAVAYITRRQRRATASAARVHVSVSTSTAEITAAAEKNPDVLPGVVGVLPKNEPPSTPSTQRIPRSVSEKYRAVICTSCPPSGGP